MLFSFKEKNIWVYGKLGVLRFLGVAVFIVLRVRLRLGSGLSNIALLAPEFESNRFTSSRTVSERSRKSVTIAFYSDSPVYHTHGEFEFDKLGETRVLPRLGLTVNLNLSPSRLLA